MDETFETGFDLSERPERCELCNAGAHDLPNLVLLRDVLPGLAPQSLEAQRDLFLLSVDSEHEHVDGFAHLHHLARMPDWHPGQLGQVNQPVRSSQVYERPEVSHTANPTRPHLSFLQLLNELVAVESSLLLLRRAL